VYALRARGFGEGQTVFSDINDAVSTYHAAIKERQPRGPYAIAGYSYGSMLAFEIAKRLEAAGDEVRFLGSFNLPPHIKARMRQLGWIQCLLHLAFFLSLIPESASADMAAPLADVPRDLAVDRVLAASNQDRLAELSLAPHALARWVDVAFSLQSAACDYEPSGGVGVMDVFFAVPLAAVASSKQEWREGPLSKWADFVRAEVRFHDVAGAHYTMIDSEHVQGFQVTLRNALAARGL
jgi:thioesterase domain-containing protein